MKSPSKSEAKAKAKDKKKTAAKKLSKKNLGKVSGGGVPLPNGHYDYRR